MWPTLPTSPIVINVNNQPSRSLAYDNISSGAESSLKHLWRCSNVNAWSQRDAQLNRWNAILPRAFRSSSKFSLLFIFQVPAKLGGILSFGLSCSVFSSGPSLHLFSFSTLFVIVRCLSVLCSHSPCPSPLASTVSLSFYLPPTGSAAVSPFRLQHQATCSSISHKTIH